MRKIATFLLLAIATFVSAQDLPYRLEELTAPDFIKAVEKSSKTCIIPIGVMEKHGAQLPLGTDLYMSREYSLRAAEQEYTVVFPWYYFSQINEARHQPGTISYSPELIWKVLQETLDELHRNGFEKIIIVNGHGGNNAFLNYFGMAQLSEPRDYSLYWFRPEGNREIDEKAEALTRHDPYDSHAGNSETSEMLATVPDVVHVDRAKQQSGVDQDRMNALKYVYTGIWWYASYPNHYGGEAWDANAEAGELFINEKVEQLVEMIKLVKTDTVVPALQEQFFKEAADPLDTKQ
ncbi:creatinine amidohydrolase [Draconibacterium orientale]|uniref:Creatininase n=1 Tax=Draconibacterium orientale TaxID=1168034 RepID=X5DK74_9BACT|nr:creatininase family protein [Draconibacterium orientale]AHW60937.1 creatininase [Draconibacterium orientale]SES63332.1 creatinine amidohydrolase [Draconibacterium orientale]